MRSSYNSPKWSTGCRWLTERLPFWVAASTRFRPRDYQVNSLSIESTGTYLYKYALLEHSYSNLKVLNRSVERKDLYLLLSSCSKQVRSMTLAFIEDLCYNMLQTLK
jgi:hypothetical protein